MKSVEEIVQGDTTDSDEDPIGYIMRRNQGYRRAVTKRKKLRNLLIRLGILVFVIIMILAAKLVELWYDQYKIANAPEETFASIKEPPHGYLVWNDQCRIPDVDLYGLKYASLYTAITMPNCSRGEPLVQKFFDNITGRYWLHIVKASKRLRENELATDEIRCCYQEIQGEGVGDYAGEGYNLNHCVNLGDNFPVPDRSDGVIVRCFSVPDDKLIYTDAHFFIQDRPEVQRRMTIKGLPFGILMFGIDGLSRYNFRRSMPATFEHLLQQQWFELDGYNKVENSTFGNMMAMLTGLSSSDFRKACPVHQLEGMENCSLIWNTFAANGYATAFAEDDVTSTLGTFNMPRHNFNHQPTDYYLHPFMQAIGKNLKVRYHNEKMFCIGTQRPAEYIFDFGMEFASRFDTDRSFGVFFSSSSSRNEYRGATSLDALMHAYLQELDERYILDYSVVILFSDQGQRHGPLQDTPMGGLEERLPMLFVWLPPWMRVQYPEFVYSLEINKHRLTSAYDIYLTLHHLMAVSTGNQQLDINAKAHSCPFCQSLLRPVVLDRDCKQAGVGAQACSCTTLGPTPEEIALNLTQLILDNMNAYIEKFNYTQQCEPLSLKQIIEAESHVDGGPNIISYPHRIVFITDPNSTEFEAKCNYEMDSGHLELDMADIKRLTPFNNASECGIPTIAKKFCICKN